MMTGASGDIDTYIAEAQIRAAVYRYCRGLDRRDRALIESTFWPDAVVNYGTFAGNAYDFAAHALEDFVQCGISTTNHMIGNVLVDVDGDTAFSESYLHAYHRVSTGARTYDLLVAGRYQDRFERRDSVWRSAERLLVFDWFREYDDSHDWEAGNVFGSSAANSTIGVPGPGPFSGLESALRGGD